MTDIRQTKEWAEYLRSWGWQIEEIDCQQGNKARIFIRKFPLLPVSFFKFQRYPGKPNLEQILEIKKRHHITYSVVEPLSREGILPGYHELKSYYVPSKTIILDLTQSIEELFNNLSENAQRILQKKSEIKTIETDLKTFYPAWKKSSKIYVPSFSRINLLFSIFGSKAKLLMSQNKNQPLSGILLLSSSNSVNYFYTWTNKAGRQQNAHYYLVWEAIKNAKKENFKYFDLEGIFDSRFPNKNWLGFSEFKKKFGGQEISFPGCFGCWF
jgi:lipid II:glycine glycyltransferase (peptidoglycan interpeptide bridge formation enzyme)